MADVFDKETRSRIMRAIKGSGTKPELLFVAAVRAARLGARIETNVAGLPGRPDLVVRLSARRPGIAIFVHGCFWHRCPRCKPRCPTSNVEFWAEKFRRNIARDVRVRRRLNRLGWSVMTVWEHEDPVTAAARLRRRIERLTGRRAAS